MKFLALTAALALVCGFASAQVKTAPTVPASQGAPAHTPAGAPVGADALQIVATMKKQFERPEAPLAVGPVTVVGDDAVAGWTQGNKGGRALLHKEHGQWQITVCAGDGLTQSKVLQTTGMAAAQADKLATAVSRAEAKLSARTLRLFASFEGLLKIDPGAGGHHGHGKP